MPHSPTFPQSRRHFLAGSLTALVGSDATSWVALSQDIVSAGRLKNDRIQMALIGSGWRSDIQRKGRGIAIGINAAEHADVTTICDVDRSAAEYACDAITGGKAKILEDYREVLSRDDIDAVLIATPDHWHTQIAIDAMKAGKDVYCEKPATLTIAEGQQLCRLVAETGRVFQVGTQQRSEFDQRFLKAIALVRDGRIGKVRRVTVGLGRGMTGGPFEATAPPRSLNWDFWLGPAPFTPYRRERCHWTFRWWYEYAGGKITDWGAHHVDIAQWAIGMEHSGPTSIDGRATFAQPLIHGQPTRADSYNTAVEFHVTCRFGNDVELVINDGTNGILFEGEEGRFFVNRGKLTGQPAEDLNTRPLPQGVLEQLCKGQAPGDHMRNFLECIRTRRQPLSDIFTHHRTVSTCHLANICIRLGRPLRWDPHAEHFIDDDEANGFLQREPRDCEWCRT